MSYRVAGLLELQQSFAKLGAATARGEARAVNRIAVSITTAQSRAVVERLNLKMSRVKEAVRLRQRATSDQPRIVTEHGSGSCMGRSNLGWVRRAFACVKVTRPK